jgi:hypothetical protein
MEVLGGDNMAQLMVGNMEEILPSNYRPHVLVNGEWIPVDDTEFINISEDLFGRDVYEFSYKGKCYSSNVIMK